jgi:tripartite ATP-independent transporter DctP family solute receptor
MAAGASAQTVTLRYAHMNPPTSVAGQQATLLAKLIEEKTKGAVKMQVFPASQLGTLQEQAEAASSGTVQVHHNTMAGIGSLYEPFGALDTPYMYQDAAHLMRVADPKSPVMQKLNEGLIKARGVRVFYTFFFGTRHLTADRQILSPKDLQGLKIRAIPFPIYMAAVEGMGAVPTPIDWAEVPTALATKAVNGQENPVDTIFAAKLYETQSHLMLTGHVLGAELVVFNDAAWKKLSPVVQGQILEAAAEASKKGTEMTLERETSLIKELAGKGMKVIGLKEGLELPAFRSRVQELVSKRFDAKFGELYKEIRAIQ